MERVLGRERERERERERVGVVNYSRQNNLKFGSLDIIISTYVCLGVGHQTLKYRINISIISI